MIKAYLLEQGLVKIRLSLSTQHPRENHTAQPSGGGCSGAAGAAFGFALALAFGGSLVACGCDESKSVTALQKNPIG